MFWNKKTEMVDRADALPGRTDQTMPVPSAHHVNGAPLTGPWPEGHQTAIFGMGCFWGVERKFWQIPGVYSTAAIYAGGFTPNPTYEETCTARTGHTEAVLVVFDPAQVSYESLLKVFWESHDPTQGNRQGNDIGSQYRSAIFTTTPEQLDAAQSSAKAYGERLSAAGHGEITTEIAPETQWYYAEPYHQQYLAKNPNGYCNLGGTGVSCQIGLSA